MSKDQGNIIRFIAGYALGIGVFVILIPYGIWYLSSTGYYIFIIPIIPLDYVRIIVSAPLGLCKSIILDIQPKWRNKNEKKLYNSNSITAYSVFG